MSSVVLSVPQLWFRSLDLNHRVLSLGEPWACPTPTNIQIYNDCLALSLALASCPTCFVCLGYLGGGYRLVSASVCTPHSQARSVVLSISLLLWVLWGETWSLLYSVRVYHPSPVWNGAYSILIFLPCFGYCTLFCTCFLSPHPSPPPVVMYFTVAGGLVCIYLAYNQYSCPYHSCLSLDVSLTVGPSNVLSYTIFFFFNWSSSLWKNLTFSFDLINAHSFSPAASTTVSFAHFSLLNFSCFWAFILSSGMLQGNLHSLCSSILPPSLIS